jgi:hypothetical protein
MKVPLLEQTVDTGLTRSMRKRREPARFKDFIPTSTVPSQMRRQYLTKKQQLEAAKARTATVQTEHDPEPTLLDDGFGGEDSMVSEVSQQITTDPDPFGVFRKYSLIPSHNPDDIDPFEDIAPSSTPPRQVLLTEKIGSNLQISSPTHETNPLADSENPTEDLLLSWWSRGSHDGAESLNQLVKCLTSRYFDQSQLKGFNLRKAMRRFNRSHGFSKIKGTLVPGDSWKTGSVKIRLPCVKVEQREEDAPEFTVGGLLYRNPVEVIMKELQDPDSFDRIHLRPFEEWWKPSESDDPVRVYSDVYTSDAMLEADRELQDSEKATPSFGPQLETFAISVGLYSDSTNLTAFSHASLWPMYMFIGNESKYFRSKPSSFSAHHVAYLPMVWEPCCLPYPPCDASHFLLAAARLYQRVLLQMLWGAPISRHDCPSQARTNSWMFAVDPRWPIC